MQKIAVYAGTFDPITFGHVDLVERATKIFDKIIVAVAESPKKSTLFTLEERVNLCRNQFKTRKMVEVTGFNCLLLDFVKSQQASIILRGLRTVTDFDYEFQLASMNRNMDAKIESIFLVPSEKYMYISSSLVREIASLGGEVSSFVPEEVVTAIKEKNKKRHHPA